MAEGVVGYARPDDGHGCGGDWDVGHRQVAEGVVGYARPDDGHGCVSLLGQKLGVHAELKLGQCCSRQYGFHLG